MTVNLTEDEWLPSVASGRGWWHRVTRAAVSTALGLALPGLVACTQAPPEPAGSTTTKTEAAIHEHSVTLTLPEGIRPHSVVVSSSDSLELSDRTKVEGSVSSAVGGIVVGNDALLRNATARGPIRIGERTQVQGNLTSGGSLTVSPSATVTGASTAGVTFGASEETTISFDADTVSAGPVALEPDQVLDLAPSGIPSKKSVNSISCA